MKNQYPLPWIEALPSWSKCQFRQEEVCFLEYVRSSHVVLIFRCSYDTPIYSPWCLGRAHQRTHQLVRPRVRSSMMRLIVVASWSKSCQKVKKLSKSWKSLKGLKICKGHRFGGMFTKAPILRQRTRASVKALTVFRVLFARPKNLSQGHFRFNYWQGKANGAADTLSKFFSMEGKSSSQEYSNFFPIQRPFRPKLYL